MEVFLQYWDELDDLWHAARFRLRESRLEVTVYTSALLLMTACAPLGG